MNRQESHPGIAATWAKWMLNTLGLASLLSVWPEKFQSSLLYNQKWTRPCPELWKYRNVDTLTRQKGCCTWTGASPAALWVCGFHAKELCFSENSSCIPGNFDLVARRQGRQVGKGRRDFCVGEGRGDGMRLPHGHRTKSGQDFDRLFWACTAQECTLGSAPPSYLPLFSPLQLTHRPLSPCFRRSTWRRWCLPGCAAVVETEHAQAAVPSNVGYQTPAAQARFLKLNACRPLPLLGTPPVTGWRLRCSLAL